MDFIKATKEGLVCEDKPFLLRGFGLGGWFLPEGYMWKFFNKCDRPRHMEQMIENLCGTEYAKEFWQQYLESYITEKDIELIAKEGFNSVRLPLNSRHLYRMKEGQFVFIPDTIARVDRMIEWCKKYKIYVILDMHGAPGGQTGQNIDDSEDDQPKLFIKEQYQHELIILWTEIAKRYADEVAVAGYDLINEPLPNWFSQYNNQVLPLYRKLIQEIRSVDRNHTIILEGVHWSTDFSIFSEFTSEEAEDNILLQFHKYWNNPDQESIQLYIDIAKRIGIPLYMGEGGENNCDWYTTAFPLYERLNISWSFWSYKKMSCNNSPITFDVPEGWEELNAWIDGKVTIEDGSKEDAARKAKRAIMIFDNFLSCIKNPHINKKVFNALNRQVPLTIPCEAYDNYEIFSKRILGATLRTSDPVTLLFTNGKIGEVDYKRYGGQEQPEDETILVQLSSQDSVSYHFYTKQSIVKVEVRASGSGTLLMNIGDTVISYRIEGTLSCSTSFTCDITKKQTICLICKDGILQLGILELSYSE